MELLKLLSSDNSPLVRRMGKCGEEKEENEEKEEEEEKEKRRGRENVSLKILILISCKWMEQQKEGGGQGDRSEGVHKEG